MSLRPSFYYNSNWSVERRDQGAPYFPVYLFKMGVFSNDYVPKGERALWESTKCVLRTAGLKDQADSVRSMTEALVKEIRDNLPKQPNSDHVSIDPDSFDTKRYPNVKARFKTSYIQWVDKKITKYDGRLNYKTIKIIKEPLRWQSSGQIIEDKKRYLSVHCKSQKKYAHLTEGLFDILATSVKP